MIVSIFDTLPWFMAYFTLALVLTLAFIFIYTKITPYDELKLISQGLIAPTLSLSGSILGFVIALASVIKNSINLGDMASWGMVALIVQLVAYLLTRLLFPNLVESINHNNIAKGLFLGTMSLAFGILNAACMTY